jgi:hypothetical protein
MAILKLSPKAMIYLNMALGTFVALTNGSALLITLGGGRSHLGGQLWEVALWAAAGLLMLGLSLIALRRPESTPSILERQVVVIFILIGALGAWGLAVVIGAHRIEGSFAWTGGFLSLLALYCYVLYSSVTAIRGWARGMRPFALAFVVACVAIDIAAFAKVMS